MHAYCILYVMLSLLFTACISEGRLSDRLMESVMAPFVRDRTGDLSNKHTYRPITLVIFHNYWTYWNIIQLFYVKWVKPISVSFTTSNDVRQGGILSPRLFILCIDDLSVLFRLLYQHIINVSTKYGHECCTTPLNLNVVHSYLNVII